MTTHEPYGHTSDGTPIDDAFVNRLADEAEQGYSPKQLKDKPRGRGRPPLGDSVKAVRSVAQRKTPPTSVSYGVIPYVHGTGRGCRRCAGTPCDVRQLDRRRAAQATARRTVAVS